jgi:hypothetical protein
MKYFFTFPFSAISKILHSITFSIFPSIETHLPQKRPHARESSVPTACLFYTNGVNYHKLNQPVFGFCKQNIWEVVIMTYTEILEQARTCMGPFCKACPTCNGMACKNSMPGPGAKGSGTGAIRNYQKWQEICVNMDTICENKSVDTTAKLFGREFAIPVFAGPVGALQMHYGDKYNDLQYNDILVSGCAAAGIAAFTGDGVNPAVIEATAEALKKSGGCGVPTVKPWNIEVIREKMDLVKQADPFAIAMDIDAAGLPFLKNLTPPAGSKTVAELKEIAKIAEKPFILKGIMTANGAKKALEAGSSGIVV